MKISAKARYGLRIMLDISVNGRTGPRTIKDIAGSQDISLKFISRLVVELRNAGFIKSVRGTRGGLKLARAPQRITLLDIVEAMDGPVSLLECLGNHETCPRYPECVAKDIWGEIDEGFKALLASFTLQTIIERHAARSATSMAFPACYI